MFKGYTIRGWHPHMYEQGFAFCPICSIAFKRDELNSLRCPFCGTSLRVRPRHKRRRLAHINNTVEIINKEVSE